MVDGKRLRFGILRELWQSERSRPNVLLEVEDLAATLSSSPNDINDQLDILKDLGAINLIRYLGGGASAKLTGQGKLLLEELEAELGSAPSSGDVTDEPEPKSAYEWDAFIAHASEDKDAFVQPLAVALSKDFRIWYDDFALTVGDSLRRSIDKGLKNSRFGIVVLSKHFFQKEWPQKELDGLTTRERDGTKVILPVWLDVEYKDVANYSPLLADRVAAKAKDGLDRVVTELRTAMMADGSKVNRQPPPDRNTNPNRFGSDAHDTVMETTPAEQPHPASTPAAVASAKRYLSDSRQGIALHDLVNAETEELYAAVANTSTGPGNSLTQDGFVQRMRRYDALTERLASMMAVIAYHDSGENSHLLARTITRLANFPIAQGVAEVLQRYPALIITYAAGIAALAKKKYRNLFAVLCEPKYRDPYDRETKTALYQTNIWSVFGGSTYKWVPRPQENEHTPANNHLVDLLLPILSEYIPDEEEYVQTFDLFEYLLALVYADAVRENSFLVGRYWWSWGRMDKPPSTRFLEDGLSQGERWPLLRAGFFEGSPQRVREVVQRHDEYLKQYNRMRW